MSSDTTRTAPSHDPAATATGPTPDSAADPSPLDRVGRFVLLGELARGGMGVVYRARDEALGREIAVKVLSDRIAARPEAVRRFLDEACVTGQLQHPGIPPVHDIGTLPNGRPFLAMKLIKGRTLDDLLKDSPDPGADRGRLIAVFELLCQAVAYAHSRGVIHRDLKPSNVMVGAFGEVQVVDWGLAKVLTDARPEPVEPAGEVTEIRTTRDADGTFTQAGIVLGSPAYMSPEQAGGEADKIDRRTDVFGLGAVLCALLTGKPPYSGTDAEAVRLMAVRGRLDDALARLDGCGAAPELVALAKRCLAVDPADRPADAGDVAQAVAGLRSAAEERARRAELDRATAEVRAAEQRKRRRVQLALLVAGVLVAALVGAEAWWQDKQSTTRRQEREREDVRLRAGVVLALDQADAALKADKPDEAEIALSQADDRLVGVDAADLTDRLAGARLDLDLFRQLDRIRDRRWGKGEQDQSWSDYRRVFSEYGIVADGVTAEQAAERVRTSRVATRIVAALDDGLRTLPQTIDMTVDPPAINLATEVLKRVDPDPFAALVRAASGNQERLRELGRQADGAVLQPTIAYRLILSFSISPEDAHRILRSAVEAHPTDFLVLYAAGFRLTNDNEIKFLPNRLSLLEEGIGYYRAAIAVRPRYANTFYDLGNALNAKEDWVRAETAFRTALRLGPAADDTYNQLTFALSSQRRYGEGLRVMRAALVGAEEDVAVNSYFWYDAACMAVRSGTGQGIDAPPMAERPTLRRQALAWLTADLAAYKKVNERQSLHTWMNHWLDDADLFAVRHPIAVGLLPPDERDAWRRLWAEVRQLQDETTLRELAPSPRPAKN